MKSVAVCGAGPSGLAAAILLRRAGWRTVLIERFAAAAPVGSGLILQPTGMAVLQALGLDQAMAAHGRRVARMTGRTSTGRLVLEVGYNPLGAQASALAVHRSALFGVLFEAALREGTELLTGIEVVAAHAGRLTCADGRSLGPFDLVVDATGARSAIAAAAFAPVRRRELAFGALWATLPWPGAPFADDRLEQRYRSASVMAGVLPIGRRFGEENEALATFFWSLKPSAYETWRAAGLDAFKREAVALWPETETLLAGIRSPDGLTLARYGHHTLARPVGERLAVIGDAAHATSPQLGQGANMGLLDAWALARALETSPDTASALQAYARARRGHVRLYQALSSLFTPFYQSDSRLLPAVRDLMLAPALHLPFAPRLLALMVAGLLADPRPRLDLEA